MALLAVPGKSPVACGFQPGLAGLAYGFTSSFVFVVGAYIPDALVEPDPVVVRPGDVEFGTQGGRVTDREQVRVLGFEVAVEALDPGLVGRCAGPAEVLRDRAQGHELPRRS